MRTCYLELKPGAQHENEVAGCKESRGPAKVRVDQLEAGNEAHQWQCLGGYLRELRRIEFAAAPGEPTNLNVNPMRGKKAQQVDDPGWRNQDCNSQTDAYGAVMCSVIGRQIV